MSQEPSSIQASEDQPQGEPLAPDTTAPEQVTAAPTYLQLDRTQLYRELSRLEAEDPDVKRVLGTFIGNKAARQYQPEIRRRDAELEALRKENFGLQVKSMDETAIEAKVAADRDWGKKYIDYVHEQRSPSAPIPVDETPLMTDAVASIMDFAQRNGMPDSEWDSIINKARAGEYETGGHWSLAVANMQQDVASRLLAAKQKPVAATTNPALSSKGPDLSSGGGASAASGRFPATAAEFNSLPVEEQKRLLSSDRDKVIALSRK